MKNLIKIQRFVVPSSKLEEERVGNPLINLRTRTNGAGIIADINNCTTGFEIAVTYGVPLAPLKPSGGAISFWPGAYVGAPSLYCWLIQPLLMYDEGTSGWSAAPAAWIQLPSGGTAAQLGWADSTDKQGNMFVPRMGDLMKSYIRYDNQTGNWTQGMQDVTTGDFFVCKFKAGQIYRGQYPCPDASSFYSINFEIECPSDPTAMNIWRGNIDGYATFTIDGQAHKQDFTSTSNWARDVDSGVPGLALQAPGLDHFKMVLPPAPAE